MLPMNAPNDFIRALLDYLRGQSGVAPQPQTLPGFPGHIPTPGAVPGTPAPEAAGGAGGHFTANALPG